ncbi:hypothetical protein MNBD_GAMMA26-527 [hydrothermal vent metagenome]|uniref:Uncharacterized protein n=1 Tax=hydrothermal vent metagenome TaxID=652676 RepID=A0A3B1AX23_9ZZZZ
MAITAITTNALVTVLKLATAVAGGSASMMNEALRSLMSTISQGLLFPGSGGSDHDQKKYLRSTAGLFSIGAGLGLAHTWHVWHNLGNGQEPVLVEIFGMFFDPLGLGLIVLGIAFIIEGRAFLITLKAFLVAMRQDGATNPCSYLLEAKNPTLVAVTLGNLVAMIGLALAIMGIGLTAVTGNGIWDVGFSALIAIMLGGLAFYLGLVNCKKAL